MTNTASTEIKRGLLRLRDKAGSTVANIAPWRFLALCFIASILSICAATLFDNGLNLYGFLLTLLSIPCYVVVLAWPAINAWHIKQRYANDETIKRINFEWPLIASSVMISPLVFVAAVDATPMQLTGALEFVLFGMMFAAVVCGFIYYLRAAKLVVIAAQKPLDFWHLFEVSGCFCFLPISIFHLQSKYKKDLNL